MPHGLERVAVVGTSCSGKTTLARRLAEATGSAHLEMDALHWGPQWTPRPLEQFRAAVDTATRGARWVCDGNYRQVRDLVWPRADTIIWLNYAFSTVFSRALRRTLRRSVRREELFAGNRETLAKSFFSRDSILLWVLRTYRKNRREFPTAFRQPECSHLRVIELRSPQAAEQLIAASRPER